jgi:hypothetical protein
VEAWLALARRSVELTIQFGETLERVTTTR